MSAIDDLIVSQLTSIVSKISEQGERLAKIETNHENINTQLEGIGGKLAEIRETDIRQQKQLENQTVELAVISEKSSATTEHIIKLEHMLEDHDDRLKKIEGASSPEVEVSKEKYKFWSTLINSPKTKWVGVVIVMVILIVTGHSDMISKVLEVFK